MLLGNAINLVIGLAFTIFRWCPNLNWLLIKDSPLKKRFNPPHLVVQEYFYEVTQVDGR